MNMLTRSLTLTVAGAIIALASVRPAQAQGGGTGAYKWYVGGHGGVLSFRTGEQGRSLIPTGGAHLLVTAKRTGLLLSADQSFGSDELAGGAYQVIDTSGAVVSSGATPYTFQGVRKFSAVLLAYPVRNRTVQPFLGLGLGILHTTGNSSGPYADGAAERTLGSTTFGTGVGGLEFRVGPVSAFGMWQVTTGQGYKQMRRVIQQNSSGDPILTRYDYGQFLPGMTHTVVGGLRISLGSARERLGSD